MNLVAGELQLRHLSGVHIIGRGAGSGKKRNVGLLVGNSNDLFSQTNIAPIWPACPKGHLLRSHQQIWTHNEELFHPAGSCLSHISCVLERAGERAALIPAQTNPVRNSWKTNIRSHVSFDTLPKNGQQVL